MKKDYCEKCEYREGLTCKLPYGGAEKCRGIEKALESEIGYARALLKASEDFYRYVVTPLRNNGMVEADVELIYRKKFLNAVLLYRNLRKRG